MSDLRGSFMIKISPKWSRVSLIVLGLAALSTQTFNCSPQLFESKRAGENSSSSSLGESIFDAPKRSPYTLMTSHQLFQSMLNVTGQSGSASGNQKAEYNARTGALADNDRLTSINAPLQMAATSLAGEVCIGLIAQEEALTMPLRRVLASVDFTQAPSQNGGAKFVDVVNKMANSFWGRDPKSTELQLLNEYYADFVAGIPEGQVTQASQTRALYLGLCSAMLSSFDAMTM